MSTTHPPWITRRGFAATVGGGRGRHAPRSMSALIKVAVVRPDTAYNACGARTTREVLHAMVLACEDFSTIRHNFRIDIRRDRRFSSPGQANCTATGTKCRMSAQGVTRRLFWRFSANIAVF